MPREPQKPIGEKPEPPPPPPRVVLHYKPITCPACGKTFGPGKGAFGCARHSCDTDARYVAAFFKAGAGVATCAAALGRSYEQVDELLRWERRRRG